MCKDNNIRESELSGLILPLAEHVEVLAYDENETRICHHIVDGKPHWCIVNKHGLFLTYGSNFTRCVGDLAAITGITDVGFAFRHYV